MNREPLSFLMWLRAGYAIFTSSVRRLQMTWQSVICLVILGLQTALTLAWVMQSSGSREEFIQIVMGTIFASIFVPLVALCYGTAGIGQERSSRTLVYLIATPTPRPLVYLSKYAAATALALAWSCGGYILLMSIAGANNRQAITAYLPAVCWGTCAYVALFQLMSVLIRFPTIVAFLYAVFLQSLVMTMPGAAKRIAVSFYVQCMMLDASENMGIQLVRGFQRDIFAPVTGNTALLALAAIIFILAAFGSYVFWRKEFV